MFEVNEAADLIRQSVADDANIIFGAGIDESLGDSIKITVIATEFEDGSKPAKKDSNKDSDVEEEKYEEKRSEPTSSFDDSLLVPDFLKNN